MSITQSQLKSQLHYCPTTGIFTWLVSKSGNRGIGSIAGCIQNGYLYIHVNKKRYRAHRLAWFYIYNCFPEKHLDHINQIKIDNRIDNLREVTPTINSKNRPRDKRNKSGVTGVRFKDNRYEASIAVDKKYIYLGTYKTIEEAASARKEAEKKYGFHFNHGETLCQN